MNSYDSSLIWKECSLLHSYWKIKLSLADHEVVNSAVSVIICCFVNLTKLAVQGWANIFYRGTHKKTLLLPRPHILLHLSMSVTIHVSKYELMIILLKGCIVLFHIDTVVHIGHSNVINKITFIIDLNMYYPCKCGYPAGRSLPTPVVVDTSR